MSGIIKFTQIKDLFSGEHISYRARCTGKALSSYIPTSASFLCEVDGQRVDPDYIPRPGDRIIFAAVPTDPGTLTTVIIAVIIAAGSYAFQRANMPTPPRNRRFGGGEVETRQVFGGPQTIIAAGAPIPLIYGQVRVGGAIVNSFESEVLDSDFRPEDDTVNPFNFTEAELLQFRFQNVRIKKDARLSRSHSALNTLIALGLGPIEEISDIRVDDQPISEFPGLVVTARDGSRDQMMIPGFNRSVATKLIGLPVLQAGPVTISTSTPVTALEVILRFPQGVYKLQPDNRPYLHEVELKVEYRLKDALSWTNLGNFFVQDFATTAVQYRIRLPDLERGEYEVRVTRITADTPEGVAEFNSFEVHTLNEIDDIAQNHPGIALIGFQQLPGDQISPVQPTNYTALVKGFRNCRIYTDGTTFTEGWTDIPAWCCGHFLTSVAGLGRYFSWDDIDILSFIAWAEHTESLVLNGRGVLERRATFNRQISATGDGFSRLQQFATGTGATLIYQGGKFRAIVDEPKPQRMTLTAANISPGSLAMAWLPKAELARRISITFLNAENDYKEDAVIQEDDAASASELLKEKRFEMLHITRPTQVAREARRILLHNKLVTRGVRFKTGLQGYTLQIGDVIGISESSVALGKGSGLVVRVVAQSTMELDDDIRLLAGTNYEIEIQHKNDGIIERKPIKTAGPILTHIVETIDGHWERELQAGDKYSIGVVDATVELYRVDELSVSGFGERLEVEVSAGLYDERVFDLSPPSVPEVVVPDAPNRFRVPRSLDSNSFNLRFRSVPYERRYAKQTRRVIDIDWGPIESFDLDHYEVWWRQKE